MKKSSVSKATLTITSRQKSLASLLALASGAASLGVVAQTAEANITYTPFNATVGFGSSPQVSTYPIDLPGTAGISLNRDAAPSGTNTNANRIVGAITGGLFARQINGRSAAPNPDGINVALRTAYGFNWNNAAGAVSGVGGQRAAAATFGNIILSTITSNNLNGPPGFNTANTSATRKYLLFQFTNSTAGNQTQYGWIGMSAATFSGNQSGLSVTFTGWAYENTGLKINAGDQGISAVPEPSSAVLSLLSALVVGTGLRQWRKSHPGNAGVSAASPESDASPQ